MQFKSLAFAAAVATTAAAIEDGVPFGITAAASGTEVNSLAMQAAEERLWFNHGQNASCDKKTPDAAQFTLTQGRLYLYSTSATPQQVWVDPSAQGQGVFGYNTGAQPLPSGAQAAKFAVNADGKLQFGGKDMMACKLDGQNYGIWIGGFDNPDCIQFKAQTQEAAEPNSCSYTQKQKAE
ncbi:uncharacterized protein K452DRAFT_280208 [Aplosporella prunicola CBS 121167]|uniref:Cell wall protein PhiA n=1 Tax=Aplosporella prunicola CBS 121167 TaxID=1176127 RepID=A0A6A6AWA4_9PEZI|nr:uncharacterized protein K452DRAFT_280208 [Aplosporella prunicola CBS 121167]KAF2136282.1 hypothetical protein K452DRAFT_280208 [Aplosporella prunicola CBS 121167]